MKFLGLISKRQRLVGLMVGEELFFLHSNYYNSLTSWIMKKALKQYDLLLCKGQMQADLAKSLLGNKCPSLFPILNGLPAHKFKVFASIQPQINSHNLVLLANGPSGFRTWYKGLDFMIRIVDELYADYPDISFTIVGDWEQREVDNLKSNLSISKSGRLIFLPPTNDIQEIGHIFSTCSAFFLMSRGDCFPNATMEAMAAGLIPIISEWTGTKEIVRMVDERLILPLDKSTVVNRLKWFFELSSEKREELSIKSRNVISSYTEENAIRLFNRGLESIIL